MGWVKLSMVAWRSSMHSRRLDWVLGEARLISSARTMLAKMGPGRNSNSPALLVEDGDPGDVAGQQVGRELDAGEAAVDGSGERLGQKRLAHAREVLDDDVAPGQQGHDARADDLFLAQDDRADRGGDMCGAPRDFHHLLVLQCRWSHEARSGGAGRVRAHGWTRALGGPAERVHGRYGVFHKGLLSGVGRCERVVPVRIFAETVRLGAAEEPIGHDFLPLYDEDCTPPGHGRHRKDWDNASKRPRIRRQLYLAKGGGPMTDPRLDGMTLTQRLTRGPLEPGKALDILEQLLVSLEASHDLGLVHGSISPKKIILTSDGKAALIGFSGRDPGAEPMARFAKNAAETGYVAPEQIADDPVGRATDLYSLGVVAYAMLVGKDPFGASEGVAADDVYYRILYRPSPQVPKAVLAGLPASVGPAIERAMSKEPQGRFSDAGSFLQSLRADSALVPAPAPPDPKQVKRDAEQRSREEAKKRDAEILAAQRQKREEEKKQRDAERLAALALVAEKRGEKDLKKQRLAALQQEEKERSQREKAAAAWRGGSAASKGGGWSRKTLALAAGVVILLLIIGVGAAFAMGAIGGSTETTVAALDTTTTQAAAVDDSTTTTTTEPVTTTVAETTTTATVTTTTLPPPSTTLSTVSSTTTTKKTTTTVKPTTTTVKPTTTTVKPTTTTVKPTTTTTVPPTTTTTAIVKKTAVLHVVQSVFAYDGASHHLIVTATGTSGEDLTSLVDPGASETDIGEYTITYTFAGNANYLSDSRAALLTIQ